MTVKVERETLSPALREQRLKAIRKFYEGRADGDVAFLLDIIGSWEQCGLTLVKFFPGAKLSSELELPDFLWREMPTLIRDARKVAYAEGRQAGAQEELKAGMSMLCDDKIAMANQTVKQYRWKLTQMWNRRYKHATS